MDIVHKLGRNYMVLGVEVSVYIIYLLFLHVAVELLLLSYFRTTARGLVFKLSFVLIY